MKYIKLFALSLSLAAACATGTVVNKTAAIPTESAPAGTVLVDRGVIIGVVWYLWEIRRGDTLLDISRLGLRVDGDEDAYSLRFDKNDRVFGKAMPNTYRGPCLWGDGSVLSFGNLVSTRMLALKEPDSLKEQEFFDYLGRVDRWALIADDRLELRSTGKDGVQVVLVFRNQR
ncbi:MAG: META domain-containing protein [Treponema sp.]|jgi:heat shock protein HslJ|nr:META domain-containing protein [Treponema sp.]